MQEKIKSIKGDRILKAGVVIYILGFFFLYFAGNNYTGFFSFLAPFSIVFGVILMSIGLIK